MCLSLLSKIVDWTSTKVLMQYALEDGGTSETFSMTSIPPLLHVSMKKHLNVLNLKRYPLFVQLQVSIYRLSEFSHVGENAE